MISLFSMNNFLLVFKCFLFYLIFPVFAFSQTGTIRGFVYEEASEEVVIFANTFIEGTDFGTVTDDNGYFIISDIPYGNYRLKVSFIGYRDYFIDFELNEEFNVLTKKCFLNSQHYR